MYWHSLKGRFCYITETFQWRRTKSCYLVIQKVFNELNLPWSLLERNPVRVKKIISKFNNVRLVEDPGEEEMKS
jgi:hypothetical protein